MYKMCIYKVFICYTHVTKINENRRHEFELEQGGVHMGV